jgi:hypothetical protein
MLPEEQQLIAQVLGRMENSKQVLAGLCRGSMYLVQQVLVL